MKFQTGVVQLDRLYKYAHENKHCYLPPRSLEAKSQLKLGFLGVTAGASWDLWQIATAAFEKELPSEYVVVSRCRGMAAVHACLTLVLLSHGRQCTGRVSPWHGQ